MEIPQHVIYLPGLGDHHSRLQGIAVNLWRFSGLTPHFHQIGWADEEPFDSKLERILDEVDALSLEGEVSLVGTSAGASAALNTFAKRQDSIKKVITICGKIQNLDAIQEWRYKKNPAFRGSIKMLPKSIAEISQNDLSRVLNLYPLSDNIVPPKDAVMDGAHKKRIPTFGHAFSIGCTVLFGAPAITRFIREK